MKKFLVIFLTALTLFTGCDLLDESKYDLTGLDAKIAEANLALEGVDTAENASDVATGRKFVTSADMKKFTDAIGSAELVRLAPISQNAVDKAVGDLDMAIFTFKNRDIKTGTKSSGFTQNDLDSLIKEAETAKEVVKTSTNGADISPQEYWVTSDKMTALTNAIGTAKGTSGTIDSKYTALNTALNNLNDAKKPGTAASWRSITITGLTGLTANYTNGTEISAGVFATNSIDLSTAPEIYGSGIIKNGQATIVFHSNNQTTLWTGEGSYYVGFMVKDDVYISKSKIAFNSTTPNPSAKYSDFRSYDNVYEYKAGDLASEHSYTIPSTGTSLNNLFTLMKGSTYQQLIANGTLPGSLYKDRNCSFTQTYTGSELIYTDTILYCKYDLKKALGLQ